MTSTYKGKLPIYVHPEDEADYRRERFELENKFRELSQKRSADGKPTDPLARLGDDLMLMIFRFLTGLELLKSMEVSTEWKNFVGGQKLLIDRALEEVRFKPNLADCSLVLLNKIFDSCFDPEGVRKKHVDRNYKHVSVSLLMTPIYSYASSLESLELKVNGWKCWEVELPKLSMLRFTGYREDFLMLRKWSLPALTHLQLICEVIDHEACCQEEIFSKWLQNFKAAKYLHVHCHWALHDGIGPDGTLCPRDDSEIDPEVFEDFSSKDFTQHRLEQLSMEYFFPRIMKHHVEFLQVFEAELNGDGELRWLLKYMKVLRVLRILWMSHCEDSEEEYPTNHSVEIISIDFCMTPRRSMLQRIFRAVPNLRKLYLRDQNLDPDMLHFVAHNLRRLKKLAISPLTPELLSTYEEIKESDEPTINSSFDLVDSQIGWIHRYRAVEKIFKKTFKYEESNMDEY